MKISNYFKSILLVIAIGSNANAQGDFTNFYGTAGVDSYLDMYQAPNGNLHVVGRSNLKAYYAQMDACGEIICEKDYSLSGMTFLRNIVPTDDGNFMVLGNPTEDMLLMKITPCGDIMWSKRYSSIRERSPRLTKGINDHYFLTSWYSLGSSSDDVLVTKIDGSGNFVWTTSNSIRLANVDDQPYMTVADGNGGITISGGLHGGTVDNFVVNIDANGALVADKEFESNTFYEATSIVRTNDGGYVTVARASTSASFNWNHVSVRKMDASFNELWSHDFNMGLNYSGRWMTEDMDGNIYVSTNTTWSGSTKPTIIKFSSNGTVLAAKSFDDASALILSPVDATTNDIFAFASTNNAGFGSSDAVLMRMDGNLNACNSQDVTPVPGNINVTSKDWPSSVLPLNINVSNANVVANNLTSQFTDVCGTCSLCPDSFIVDAGPCQVVYPGYGPAECVTLTATASGGVGMYTYEWDDAAMSTTASITICPTSATTYHVIATDENGCTTEASVTVNAVDVSCGKNGDKVQVCHIPPGNNGNPQNICISANAVPAHIDQSIGHSSGCHLGLCGAVDPCSGLAPASNQVKSAVIEMEGTPKMIVYPSVLVDDTKLTVEFSGLDNGVVIEVYSMSGNRIVSLPQSAESSGDRHVTIDLSDALSGVYLCKIYDESGNKLMQRFTIAK